MDHYERIAEAIRFLEEHHPKTPDLATLSAGIGLSPSRFDRLFAAWAGAVPKDFPQCLTLSHTRESSQLGASMLAGAPDPGLPGSGRWPAPRINLVSATPGEINTRGAGLTIHAGIAACPFGHCLIGETARGICHLSFFDPGDRANAITEMRAEWPLATVVWNDPHAVLLAARIFAHGPATDPTPPWKVFVRGTRFQVRVWRTLLRVPAGTLISYGNLAAAVGNPNAARAVGTAVAGNPVAFLIPCHRVIRQTGGCGQYHWGAVRKRAMLAWEHARMSARN